MPARRWAFFGLVALLALAGAASLAFGPIVRSQVDQRAQRYGLLLSINSVRPAAVGVRLLDVTVSIPEAPSVSIHLDEVLIDSDGAVLVTGGSLSASAPRPVVIDQLIAWRRRVRSSTPPSSSPSHQRKISLNGFSVSWPGLDGPESSLEVSGLHIDDALRAREASAASAILRLPHASVDVSDPSIAWSAGPTLLVSSVRAKIFRAEVWIGDRAAPSAPIPPGAPAGSSSALAAASAGAPSASSALSTPPVNPATQVALRDRLARFASLAWAPMTRDAKLEVEGFEVKLHRGADQVNIGPGKLAAALHEGILLIDLSPKAEEGKKGITFRASVPLDKGPVVFDVVGGPIRLSTLGVHEGDLGLIHVDKTSLETDAHLKLHEDGKNVSFDGKVSARDVSVSHPKLASLPVEGLELAAKLRGQATLDGSLIRLDEGEVDVGKVQLRLRGTMDRTRPKMQMDVHFAIPLVGCQAFLDALPVNLIPTAHGMTAAGTLSLDGHLRYDEADIGSYLLQYEASNDCRVTHAPKEIDVGRFGAPFSRKVYDAKGKLVEIEAGPGAPGWVGRGGINRFMDAAVMTTEDGNFLRHRGFDHEAIRNSVRENLQAGRFVRGASTISMQLAKNLYLDRSKTLSRKLQELILTVYLEQALTKDQILELYLNVIEFGPDIYGIAPAAAHYFRTHPASLSLGQSMYLASILPNPKQQHFAAGGRVSEGWTRYLQKLMFNASRRGWITEVDLEYGRGEWVVFGQPDPERVDGLDLPGDGLGEAVAPTAPEAAKPPLEGEEPFGWKNKPPRAY